MNLDSFFKCEDEKPLDNFVTNDGMSAILRTVGCIGDSLSSGEFESLDNDGNKGYHDYFDFSWGQFMARDAGLTVYNFSRGGMSAEAYCERFADSIGAWNEKIKCRAYIIAMGVNDITGVISRNESLGSIDDVDFADFNNNKKTFAGYYAKIIQRYKTIQPKAKFFLMTIPKGDVENARTPFEEEHRKILYSLSERFENCYVLDFRKYAPVYGEDFRSKFFLGGHMNAAGYRLTALMTESYIDYIIRHNMEDFSQIGFVGTDFHNSGAKW